MASFVRKTVNDALTSGYYDPSVADKPSDLLQWMRRRYTPLKGFESKLGAGIAAVGAPFTLGMSIPIGLGFGAVYHGVMLGLASPMEAGRAAVRTVRFLRRLGQGTAEFGGPVVDTQMAYTMRQSALQAMHDSAYSLRSAIGNEARLLHS